MSRTTRVPRAWTGIVATLVLAIATSAVAQNGDPAPASAGATGFATPQSAVRGFRLATDERRWTEAAEYLDLRNLPRGRRAQRGIVLAQRLRTVLDRALVLDLDDLSPSPEGHQDDGQPAGRDLIGVVATAEGPARLYLERVQMPDGAKEWRFSRTTVARIDLLWEEYGQEPDLARWLPPVFFETRALGTELWQWIGILLLALLAALVAVTVAVAAITLGRIIVRRTVTTIDDAAVDMAVGPLRMVVWSALFSGGLYVLRLPLAVHHFFGGVAKGVLAVALTWVALRVVTVLSRSIQLRMAARGDRVGISAVPLVRRVVNAFVVLLAGLIVLAALGVNVTGIVAGLGVGGLAVALAAQKSLENLFGGLTLIVDQPVHVGDFCRFGDKLGTIEDIGLRSTRIRTLDRTMVTVPNAEFASMQIENFARRDRIWLKTTIGVRYETTADQLRFLLVEMKKMLLAHPRIDNDPARVRFVGFGAFSLDIEIFAYVKTTDYNDFLAVREDVFLRLIDVVAHTGTGFAFPSQTVYTAPDGGLDPERTRAAEEQVARWRAEGRLFVPTIPAPEAQEITDTLDYPPEGAPDAQRRRLRLPTGPGSEE